MWAKILSILAAIPGLLKTLDSLWAKWKDAKDKRQDKKLVQHYKQKAETRNRVVKQIEVLPKDASNDERDRLLDALNTIDGRK